jgi:pyrroloquinoline quinone biosynthesis protein E
LLPSRDRLDAATATVEAARARLAGVMLIDYVLPDYYAHRPKACMGTKQTLSQRDPGQGAAVPCGGDPD